MEAVLTSLVLLACPVGMGLMMWLMMRGGRSGQQQPRDARSLDELRAEQRWIVSELDRLEAREQGSAPEAAGAGR